MVDLKKWGRDALAGTGKRLFELADRADEAGGELRDQLKAKLEASRRLQALKESLAWGTIAEESTQKKDERRSDPVIDPTLASKDFSFGDERKAAQIFGARSCAWSGRAVRLFEAAGIAATYVDLDQEGSGPLRDQLRSETGQLTVPYVYLRGRFIGGFNALDEIHRLGQLAYFVLPDEQRRAHPDHGKIEVAPRNDPIDAVERPPES